MKELRNKIEYFAFLLTIETALITSMDDVLQKIIFYASLLFNLIIYFNIQKSCNTYLEKISLLLILSIGLLCLLIAKLV